MKIEEEYKSTTREIKLSAIEIARDSALSAYEKGRIFEELSVWASEMSRRIFYVAQMEAILPQEDINQ